MSQSQIRIESIDPVVHPIEGGTQMMIYGSGFPSEPTVKIGTKTANVRWRFGDDRISVDIPDNMEGQYSVRVSAPNGSSGTLQEAVRYESLKLPPVENLECYMLRGGTQVRLNWSARVPYDSFEIYRSGDLVR
ncbi:MAG: IPT/TIG domain-containing protein, partial [Planctomycetota bacterium]